VWSALLAAGLAVSGAAPRSASGAGPARLVAPRVPLNLHLESGQEPFLVGHATGTQNYVCLASGSGFAWSLFTPEATLFDDDRHPIVKHYFGPNPLEGARIRAAWQDCRDASTVWGRAVASSTDPTFVEAGAIPWLLVSVKDVGARPGPTGGRRLVSTSFIQRVNTHGGAAPGSGCSGPSDVGHRAFVPYSADYVFYAKASPEERHGP
jgi:hypothetical protein